MFFAQHGIKMFRPVGSGPDDFHNPDGALPEQAGILCREQGFMIKKGDMRCFIKNCPPVKPGFKFPLAMVESREQIVEPAILRLKIRDVFLKFFHLSRPLDFLFHSA